jgi:hypothetical protein
LWELRNELNTIYYRHLVWASCTYNFALVLSIWDVRMNIGGVWS